MNNTTITIAGTEYTFDETKKRLFAADGTLIVADVVRISEGEYSILMEGKSIHLFLHDRRTVTIHSRLFDAVRLTPKEKLAQQLQQEAGSHSSAVTVRAPMPGLVAKVLRREGETVSSGDGILVVEAMKMENEIKSPKAGTIITLSVKEKQTVEKNDPLFTIE